MTEPAVKNRYSIETTASDTIYRYAAIVEYVGDSFAGSQIQPNQRTVQSELENALAILVGKPVKSVFSGRTDRGVHSKGQVAHFDTTFELDIRKFLYSLNGILPKDISVRLISKVDTNFHSQKSAVFRWYRYLIYNRQQRSAGSSRMLHVYDPLDTLEINKALTYLIGHHDFTSFKSLSTENPAKDCTMHYAKCSQKGNVICIDLIADRFLYNMVRIIVGTLLPIGQGSKPSEYMNFVLEAKDRTTAGKTASPEGLTLMHVSYGSKYNLFERINKEANPNENILCKAS